MKLRLFININFKFLTLTLISSIAISCESPPAEKAEFAFSDSSLFQTHQAWSAALREGDVAKILSFWDEDAVDYFPKTPVARGINAIKQRIKQNSGTSGFALTSTVKIAQVAKSGEIGYTAGAFSMTRDDTSGNAITEHGNFMCIWEKTSGVWRCIQSMSTLEYEKNSLRENI